MKQRKIAVIAGTSDATDWIRSLPETDSVTAFVATPYGKEILAGTNCTVHVGRLDAAGFAEALTGFDEVVDASHPFAVVVTETVKAVCQAKQIPYTRISRPTLHYDYEKLHIVSSKEAAADWLCSCTGNLFFTVGIQTLPFYAAAVTDFSHRALQTKMLLEQQLLPVGRLLYPTPVQMPDGRNPSPLLHKTAAFECPP